MSTVAAAAQADDDEDDAAAGAADCDEKKVGARTLHPGLLSLF